ncbi:MAG: LpxI family protein [Hyphomicrobiales bacterium]
MSLGGPARAGAPSPQQGPIALLCAGGALPFAVAEAMRAADRRPVIVAIRGIAEPELDRLGATWLSLGELGKLFALLRRENCAGVVLIGAMNRPSLRSMRIDRVGWSYLFDFLRNIRRGDDGMLRGMMRWFEDRGFPVIGVGEVAPELLAPEGAMGKVAPPAEALVSAARGFACLDALSPFDVGQALVAFGERIVAVEGAEGTDALIDRVAEIARQGRASPAGRGGLLLKAAKVGQSLKVDLPVIGPRTVERAAAAGLGGVVVEAHRVLVLECAAVVAAADAAGLFLVGLKRGQER